MRPIPCILLLSALPVTAVLADRIHLKSGGQVEGEVVRETPEAVTVKAAAGTMEISRSQIESIERKGYAPPPSRKEEPAPAAPGSQDAFKGEIPDVPISGRIRGKDWTGVVAEKGSFWKPAGKTNGVRIYPERENGRWTAVPHITVYVPMAVGKYTLREKGCTVTYFTPPGENDVGDEGRIEVYEISDDRIKFGLVARFSEQSYVSGRMEVPLTKGDVENKESSGKPEEQKAKASDGQKGLDTDREQYLRENIDRISKAEFPENWKNAWAILGFRHEGARTYVEVEPAPKDVGYDRFKYLMDFSSSKAPVCVAVYCWDKGRFSLLCTVPGWEKKVPQTVD